MYSILAIDSSQHGAGRTKDNAPSSRNLKIVFTIAIGSLAVAILIIGIDELRAMTRYFLFGVWDPILNKYIEQSVQPQIMAEGDNVYVIWLKQNGQDGNDIMFAKSSDNGATFGKPVMITNIGTGFSLAASEDGSRVYVFWNNDVPNDKTKVVLRASTNAGLSFGPIMNISTSAAYSLDPQIMASTNSKHDDIYLVWHEMTPVTDKSSEGMTQKDEIFFQKLTQEIDGSKLTSQKSIKITNDPIGYSPTMALSNNSLHVMWYASEDINSARPNNEIFYANSKDLGKTFSPPVNMSSTAGNSIDSMMAPAGNNVYITWAEEIPLALDENGNSAVKNEIYLRASTDGGKTFGNPILLTGASSAIPFRHLDAPLFASSPNTILLDN